MFNWLYKWLYTKISNSQKIEILGSAKLSSNSVDGSPNHISADGMRFTIHQASNGGYVMEYHEYDNKTDRRHNRLHIIKDDEDLGTGIGHVVTLELLRR